MRGSPGGEPPHIPFVDDVFERRLSGCVHLEGDLDEGCALWVDDDTVDLAPFEEVGSVEVTDGRSPEGSAVLGFLAHLVCDVRAVRGGPVLVEGGEDAVHELPLRAGIDLFRCGDEFDATLVQVGHHDRIVETVPGEAGQLVNDDKVDILIATDAFEHLLECNALSHLRGATTRLDELRDNRQAQLLGLSFAGHALCRYGDAFWVVVGVQLPLA
nr:hypothetical protein [Microbacterium liquefaciens]